MTDVSERLIFGDETEWLTAGLNCVMAELNKTKSWVLTSGLVLNMGNTREENNNECGFQSSSCSYLFSEYYLS